MPGWLLLVDVHHLQGKLKGSRLAPDGWHPDIWDAAWQIGVTGNTMMVLDLYNELCGSEDPLGKLGRSEMEAVLKEFCEIMDGREGLDRERLTSNLLMRFLCVGASSMTS